MKLRALALPLLLIYPLYGGVMYAKQRTILFPAASSEHHALSVELPVGARPVELPASFGTVRAVYWPAPGSVENHPTILYLHGNFERIENSFAAMPPLVRAGVSVLQLEYPGYGGADGDPSYAQLSEAANLAYDWLAQESGADPQRIVVMGYSIGGGVAGELTRQRTPRALILLSTYTSLEDIAHRYLLPGFLLRYPYDTLARVREFPGPVYVEHGRRDRIIPFALGQRLGAASKRADFVALDRAHEIDRGLFAERIPAWLVAQGLLDRPSSELEEHRDARNSE
ncbi:alpha/beta hydrolase [Rudaea sp.]|uniref:alpha/beta hydrolase n=1 Tax=Rudaea sp. TaxID=2136325 RepID=UPI002ED5C04B